MALGVGERVEVLVGRLGGLAQHQPAVLLAPAQVPALLVGRRALRQLGHVRQLLAGDPGQDARIERRSQIVGVRHEGVAVAALEQRRQHARGEQRGVDVAVPRRAPLQPGIGRPLDGHQPVDQQLGLLVLDEVERDVGRQRLVALEHGERLVARVEGVHQHEREPRPAALAQREHLADDHVEEREPLLDLEQRLRPVHPHRGAKAAVELDDHRLVERRLGLGQRLGVLDVIDGIDVGLRDQPRLARRELVVVVAERLDRGARDALALHLLDARRQPLRTHSRADASGSGRGLPPGTTDQPRR